MAKDPKVTYNYMNETSALHLR